ELAATVVVARLNRARGGRKRSAHQDRRHGEDQRRQQQSHDRRDSDAELNRAAKREIDFRDDEKQQRRNGRRQRDEQLELRVKGEGILLCVGAAAEEGAAEAEAGHEDGEDGGGGGGRGAEDQPELPQPDGLINERAETGPEKERADLPR